ncbi:MAG: hypothetical protein AAFQ40_12065 [Cyanobacteria bacterium J06623_5]
MDITRLLQDTAYQRTTKTDKNEARQNDSVSDTSQSQTPLSTVIRVVTTCIVFAQCLHIVLVLKDLSVPNRRITQPSQNILVGMEF